MVINESHRVVIVGAGHGGVNVAALLRQHGMSGPITLLSDETTWPYQRPPLSKDYLKGAMSGPELLIKPEDFYAGQQIDLRSGSAANAIDTVRQAVQLADGAEVIYDTLVLATGAAARPLPIPGEQCEGVHYLRSRSDAEQVAEATRPGARLVIIGGGYVGLEVAASARHLGANALVLEREDRALARVASAHLADYLVQQHARHGTTIRTGADVISIEGDASGRVTAVCLADGTRHGCDAVLIGVGAVPRSAMAEQAGIVCDGGILVDESGRTSVPNVYAVGDVTRRPLDHFPGRHRLESIPSAVEQAKQVVADLLGAAAPAREVPWFWSDQYDVKIKIAGLVGFGERSVLRGDPNTGKFSVFHLASDAVVAAETVNSAPDLMLAKKLIASSAHVDAARLADIAVSPKELLG